jgi:hypothetical protein
MTPLHVFSAIVAEMCHGAVCLADKCFDQVRVRYFWNGPTRLYRAKQRNKEAPSDNA